MAALRFYCVRLGLVLFCLPAAGQDKPEKEDTTCLKPEIAAQTMVVPQGFEVTLFAAEPEVRQPIGFCLDDRGRMWVAEAYSYPRHATTGKDRIVILEDTDGDGRHDQRTVFYDKLNYVTGIEVGFGGAWVVSPPNFYFIPDRNQDDVPDGPPQTLLDGLGNHANSHNLANGLAWGPDGWLYGTHGRTNWSLIGKPGDSDEQRVRFDGGVYRYHPLRHKWEPFADGTTNPWGIDWDDYGQGFVCNCVNPHLFHVIQGAHYEPWRNRKSSQHAYARIPTIADHLHYTGARNVRDGLGSDREDAAGGGHAHCGTMVYLGDNWPAEYRNTLFTNNIHGRRINNDILRRKGASYVASHGADLLRSKDPWFVGVTLAYGPGGEVYVSDWSDTGECHYTRNTQKETGRIYRISYGRPTRTGVDLRKRTDEQLVELQLHRNDWLVRHARRLLQERHGAGRDLSRATAPLRQWLLDPQRDVAQRLRALWALHSLERADARDLLRLLSDPSEHLRSWSVRLLCEAGRPAPEALRKFRQLASSGDSPLVRLHLASALQRLRPQDAWPIGEALAQRGEDAGDASLPLMVWYGVEPLVHDDVARFLRLGANARIPLLRQHVARRAAALPAFEDALEQLAQSIAVQTDRRAQGDLLDGMLLGLEGRRTAPAPKSWPQAWQALQDAPENIRQRGLRLALIFGDESALQVLVKQAANPAAPREAREAALDALVARKAPEATELLLELIADRAIGRAALRGLAAYNHPRTAEVVLRQFAELDAASRQDALQTLASRKDWAAQLLDAVADDRVAAKEITAYTARQLRSLGDQQITARLKDLWGEIRESPRDREKLIADYKKQLTAQSLQQADRVGGQALFKKHCATCHRLFGEGGQIGPDITGAQRTNIDYLLENLLDPSALVAKDFHMQTLRLKSGRVVTGLIESEDGNSVKLFTVNQRLVIPQSDISQRQVSPRSIMPEGVLQQLSLSEVRDLIAYLQTASPKK